jgi:tetratricopeptide (TPR) repeat protein
MSDIANKPVIFISFSHKDEPETPGPGEVAWLTFVQSFLAPVVKAGIFELWTDERLHGGDEIDPAIARKLAECDIFVLLVSRHSLASAYVVDKEITTIKKRQQDGQDVRLFPIVLSPFPKAALGQVEGRLLRPKDGDPLSLMSKDEREVAMATIADEIAEVAQEAAARKAEGAEASRLEQLTRNATLESLGLAGDRLLPESVDISHLPETPYERLVGRDAELLRLDQAWTDPNTNVISLIAEGGAGKSALVNEWLGRMRTDRFRGADPVLAWSFYSQGTEERATSADQFLNWAIEKLGIKVETTSATAKGEAIAEAIGKRRILLVLDGCEPLQHGLDSQQGELKDQGLRALLRRLASTPPSDTHGLIVLTSRLAVKDIARWRETAAPVVDVSALSDEAGAALLRDNGIWGTDKELLKASHDFGGHALALGLLASYLKEKHFGDARQRDHIRGLLDDEDNPRHDQARRVMESYERDWLAGHPLEFSIMKLVGLFDRPASADCLKALRQSPTIAGLTDVVIDASDSDWMRAVVRLRAVRLLAPLDPTASESLDAHPLVREWFGQRLRKSNEAAWRAAHGRLFDYLQDSTKEGSEPTLKEFEPLYQAIAHGCRAGRYEEALDNVYVGRILRRRLDGHIEFYAPHKLGALGIGLATISWFFETAYDVPAKGLAPQAQTFVLAEAAIALREQGRLVEGISANQAVLQQYEEARDWRNAAVAAANLGEAELLTGRVTDAVATAMRGIDFADNSGDPFQAMARRADRATVICTAGRLDESEALFLAAEKMQQKLQRQLPILYSRRGYMFCDLLIEKGNYAEANDRASKTIQWLGVREPILDLALDKLTVGRSVLGLALSMSSLPDQARSNSQAAKFQIFEAVEKLRETGSFQFMPRGFLVRAVFNRCIGDWDAARRDLDEVEEIAEPGPMKLYLCDMALERARVALAEAEAFAPLNGLIEDGPPAPVVPDPATVAQLKEDAARQVAIAADYIQTCGYHRRDEELAELQAVLRGERKFADLPPRV